MKLSETNQPNVTGKQEAKRMSAVDAFSPEQATKYARKMFEWRVKGWGDETLAMEDCSDLCGMTPRSFKRLMKGETKDVGLRMWGRVRKAYLDFCARQVAALQAEIAAERGKFGDAHFDDLGAEAEALAAKIEEARKGRYK